LNPTIDNDLVGIVACGGQSKRMGQDKSLLVYHDKPQRYFLADLLKSFCNQVFISCNSHQAGEIDEEYPFIIDDAKFSGHGPISGLLSCFEELNGKALLFIGCDYPFLGTNDIQQLITGRIKDKAGTAFFNSNENIPEPLLAIYEASSYPKLLYRFNNKKYSLKHFLLEEDTMMIVSRSMEAIKSIDTYNEYSNSIASKKHAGS